MKYLLAILVVVMLAADASACCGIFSRMRARRASRIESRQQWFHSPALILVPRSSCESTGEAVSCPTAAASSPFTRIEFTLDETPQIESITSLTTYRPAAPRVPRAMVCSGGVCQMVP